MTARAIIEAESPKQFLARNSQIRAHGFYPGDRVAPNSGDYVDVPATVTRTEMLGNGPLVWIEYDVDDGYDHAYRPNRLKHIA
jgi:hypothetical protein